MSYHENPHYSHLPSNNTGLIIGLSVGGGILLCGIVAVVLHWYRNRNPVLASPLIAEVQMAQNWVGDEILNGIQNFELTSTVDIPFGMVECTICLHEFELGQQLLEIPSCHHVFHSDCIRPILMQSSTCPVCRTPISLDVEQNA
ncbi:hypothetical protein FRX31_028173 [Thalictrum thalictroides]|uniref:RING-type E3 ubiquitin transferase n=1 Tax=Thalictrum thalictroides TaxID=46969 RepID=A0A7J6VAY5_THATH|nr:hypothetical protein FRX31_028173 [Thalictrum thalictroides]